MNVFLWILQGVLALLFVSGGGYKASSTDELAEHVGSHSRGAWRVLKATFLRGAALRPLAPVESKDPNTRYVHLHENEPLDEDLLARWIERAAAIPGDPHF